MSKRAKVAGDTIVRDLSVVSDLHVGCQLGLCPPDGFQMDGGGMYLPNRAQNQTWEWWLEYNTEYMPFVTKGRPYSVVVNGDAIDGKHHGATHQWSHNIKDQRAAAAKVLWPIAEAARKSGGNYYHIRGTEAHVGQSGEDEEALAKDLGAVPNASGQHARWEMWMRLDWALVHFTHHIGTAGSAAYETSAVARELMAAIETAARWNEEMPHAIIRSHRHTSCKVTFPSAHGDIIGHVSPSWQLKSPFAFKVAGARQASPQIGGLWVHAGDRIIFTEAWVRNLPRAEEVRA